MGNNPSASVPNPHRGRWQAQGDDIDRQIKGGRSTKWDQALPPTKDDGLELLAKLADLCGERERKLRETVCKKAKRFVKRLPLEGIPASGSNKPFYVQDAGRFRGARIDLEIAAGMAFSGPPL